MSALDRPGVGVEEADEDALAAAAVTVAECVAFGGVARTGEVGEFVVDDVVAELGGEEDVEEGEADAALAGVAGAEDIHAVGDFPAVDTEAEVGGELACARKEYGGCDAPGYGFDGCVDGRLDGGIGCVGGGWEEDVEAPGGRNGEGEAGDSGGGEDGYCDVGGGDGDDGPGVVARTWTDALEVGCVALDGVGNPAAGESGGDVDFELSGCPAG